MSPLRMLQKFMFSFLYQRMTITFSTAGWNYVYNFHILLQIVEAAPLHAYLHISSSAVCVGTLLSAQSIQNFTTKTFKLLYFKVFP